jgi:hypothetical protein
LKVTTKKNLYTLLGKVPAASSNSLLLILMYWKVYDGIEIPSDLAKQLIEAATPPETITRCKRKIVKELKESSK